MDKCTKWTNGKINGHKNRLTERHMGGWTLVDGRTGGQMNRQRDGQKDR